MGAAEKLLRSFLARNEGRKYKVTPPRGCQTMNSPMAKACNSEDRLPDAKASKKAVLIVKDLREAARAGSYGSLHRDWSTKSRSQAGQIFLGGGLEL